MTEPPDDGAGPSPTRAERRAQRSRRDRRRARRTAGSGRTAEVAPPPPPTGPTGPTEPEPEPEPDAGCAVEPRGSDVVASPAVADTTSGPPVSEPSPGPTRRERRTGGRRARRAAPTPAAPGVAPPVERPPATEVPHDPPRVAPSVPVVAAGPPPVEPAAAPDALPAPEPVAEAPGAAAAPPTGSRRARREQPARSRTRPTPEPRPRPAREPAREPARPAVSTRGLWLVVIPLIVLALVVAVVVGDRLRSDDAAARRAGSRELAVRAGAQPTLMVHHGPLGNDLVAITGRDGDEGGVLMVPPNLRVDALGDGVATLRGLAVDDGGRQLTTIVENILGVRIGRTVVLDDPALTSALGPAAPIPVDLGDEVRFVDRPARYRAGQQGLSAAQATELMTAPQPGSELDQLVDAGAVFSGWFDRLQDDGIARRTLAVAPDLAGLVKAASAPGRRVDTLPVQSLGIGGSERYVPKPAETATLVGRMFPDARVGRGGRRARTEIYNGVGALGVAPAVAEKVVPVGARVVRTDNVSGFGVTQTQIVYYRDEWRGTAQAMVDAMGCGSLRKARSDQDLGIADVTIIVGSDCPAYAAPGGAR